MSRITDRRLGPLSNQDTKPTVCGSYEREPSLPGTIKGAGFSWYYWHDAMPAAWARRQAEELVEIHRACSRGLDQPTVYLSYRQCVGCHDYIQLSTNYYY